MADNLDTAHLVGMLRACAVVGLWRSAYYKPARDDRLLKQRIREIAKVRVRYRYLRIHILLRRKG